MRDHKTSETNLAKKTHSISNQS